MRKDCKYQMDKEFQMFYVLATKLSPGQSAFTLLHSACCHTEVEVVDKTCNCSYKHTETGPTSPRTEPIMQWTWQSSHLWTIFTEQNPKCKGPGRVATFEPSLSYCHDRTMIWALDLQHSWWTPESLHHQRSLEAEEKANCMINLHKTR